MCSHLRHRWIRSNDLRTVKRQKVSLSWLGGPKARFNVFKGPSWSVHPLQLQDPMGSNKTSILIVLFAAIVLSACGSAEISQLPYRSADGVETETEGTFTGTVINNDPNKVFVSYNGQSEMPKIKMAFDGVLKCSLRLEEAEVQLDGAQFTIRQGSWSQVLVQDEIFYSDLLVLGGSSFSVSCAGPVRDSNGFTHWVVSSSVEVLLVEGPAVTDSPEVPQPLGPKDSLAPQ
jgi:hypothetical protein